ncbi:MAG: AAA family ATPase [Candidatus Firestonebacteria bacterium RIFOXYC2_FULL_39_67]|nr:MAG: AAA family ATPase [Candidatus Firestonebacteria bacterium RIFOXYD2_FULL_39_29]OGF54480.1 MAG: AAA family ATPase [Candidatus Firestonebacteria bacterium RifOxyC12_full_39_7]OGF56764.1 MAG: AAA family ATPase [Candidatus Firestonebacteria bacterium RIFOXYC2_FULL_39_67]
MQEVLNRYNPWWDKEYIFKDIIDRPFASQKIINHIDSKHIVFLTGLRRVGKTTLLKLTIKHLIKRGVKPEEILYVSLDDYMLLKYSIQEIIEDFRKIHKLSRSKKVYLFFDEITYKKDYELQLKNTYDSENAKVFASSSSASLIRQNKSLLTGRHYTLEILPLDFSEYLSFKNISIKTTDSHLEAGYFEDFMKIGGLPEYVLEGNIEYLKELVDDIILKDIAAFHNIRNTGVLKDFFLLLMERAGKQVSLNKMAHIIKIPVDSAKRYFEMFLSTYLIHAIPRFGKTNETILAPKKIYAADLGMRNLFTGFRDKGSLFENYVFLKIKGQSPAYIYKDKTELDFMTAGKTLIEVKYNEEMNEKQKLLFEQTKAKKKFLVNSFKLVNEIADR